MDVLAKGTVRATKFDGIKVTYFNVRSRATHTCDRQPELGISLTLVGVVAHVGMNKVNNTHDVLQLIDAPELVRKEYMHTNAAARSTT